LIRNAIEKILETGFWTALGRRTVWLHSQRRLRAEGWGCHKEKQDLLLGREKEKKKKKRKKNKEQNTLTKASQAKKRSNVSQLSFRTHLETHRRANISKQK
jgi:hypothetical protein